MTDIRESLWAVSDWRYSSAVLGARLVLKPRARSLIAALYAPGCGAPCGQCSEVCNRNAGHVGEHWCGDEARSRGLHIERDVIARDLATTAGDA